MLGKRRIFPRTPVWRGCGRLALSSFLAFEAPGRELSEAILQLQSFQTERP